MSALTWNDILKRVNKNDIPPNQRRLKTEQEWRQELADDVFKITRLKGTEAPGSSDMCQAFEPGIYACACCHTPLFNAEEKFDSGTGWPSFTQSIEPQRVMYHKDVSFGMLRIEALCATCDAHLGHVFPDGPPPYGLRYCINALALEKM